jgi:hypothetical protein
MGSEDFKRKLVLFAVYASMRHFDVPGALAALYPVVEQAQEVDSAAS